MYGYIYLTTNIINNRKYIGKHKSQKFNEKYKGSGRLLWDAINKYGIDNFKTELIEECKSKEDLNEKEKYWIKYYRAQKSREYYNISAGGDGGDVITGLPKELYDKRIEYMRNKMKGNKYLLGHKHSEKTRRKISEGNKGHKLSNEHKEKLRKSAIGNKYWLGKHHKDSTRNKIRISQTGERNSCYGKKMINNGLKRKYVYPEELGQYLNDGWILGNIRRTKDEIKNVD